MLCSQPSITIDMSAPVVRGGSGSPQQESAIGERSPINGDGESSALIEGSPTTEINKVGD